MRPELFERKKRNPLLIMTNSLTVKTNYALQEQPQAQGRTTNQSLGLRVVTWQATGYH